ncbi:hypothetical protein niasHS_005163 [Heterodera schachtii]|uniref:MULE transposase domain-containing protein n=1 Tax=Heterodera schachtii TaxID=97005 RepID=A0ABD2JRR4_HETSC
MIRNKLESLQKSRKKRYISVISNTNEDAVNLGVELGEPNAVITFDNAESRRQKIKESVLAEPCLKPTRLLAKVRRSAADEAFVAMSSNNALTQMMRREKRKLLGNVDVQNPLAFVIPATLREKGGEDIVLYDSRNVRQGEKDVVLIFGSVKTLGIFRQCGTWHLDGTFKCAPTMWEQCFVIGASVHQRMCICMWCLLPGKQRRYYEEALNFLRERISPEVPSKVLCDFEKDEIASVRTAFPTAQIKCCMFHYGQSLYRNFKPLGLVHLYGEKTERGEEKCSFFATFAYQRCQNGFLNYCGVSSCRNA